jgi:hypothetical protein
VYDDQTCEGRRVNVAVRESFEAWEDEENEDEVGRILDRFLVVAYGTMVGLAFVIVVVMYYLGA